MVNCVVCRYWSERLEETRTHHPSKSALELQRRLTTALRTHQEGACASRFPDLLRDITKQEPGPPDKALGSCDPARARILVHGRYDELAVTPTYGWRYLGNPDLPLPQEESKKRFGKAQG